MGSTDGMTLRAVELHRQTIQPPIAALATTGNFIYASVGMMVGGILPGSAPPSAPISPTPSRKRLCAGSSRGFWWPSAISSSGGFCWPEWVPDEPL